MTGVWVTNDTISATRMNEKTIFQGSGAAIAGLTTYSGMLAFCTSSGSGFVVDTMYQRNTANTTWIATGTGRSGDQVYPLSVTIGDYTAPAAPVASSNRGFNFSSSTGWTTTDSGALNVDTVGGTIDFNTDTTNVVLYYDLTSISDSGCNIRFKYTCANFSATVANIQYFLICLSDNTSNIVTSNDSIGFGVRVDSAGSLYQAVYGDGGTPRANTQNFAESVGAETFYIEIKRTSTTSFTVSLYSDAAYTTLVEAETVTIPATITGLRYIKLLTLAENATNELNGTIDDMSYNTTASTPGGFEVNVIDDSTSTSWISATENNPNIYVDLGSAKELHAIALNIDKTLTTETEIQVRASTDTTFTSPEVVRTLAVSDFTDDTWRFITIPRATTDKRYVQLYGSSNSVILAVNEVKYLTKSAADFEKGHFHRYISPTNSGDNGLDSN